MRWRALTQEETTMHQFRQKSFSDFVSIWSQNQVLLPVKKTTKTHPKRKKTEVPQPVTVVLHVLNKGFHCQDSLKKNNQKMFAKQIAVIKCINSYH